MEDQTFQPILVKPSDFPLEKPIKTNHFGNLFTEESIRLHTRGLTTDNLIEKITNYSLSNQKLVEKGTMIC